MSYFKTKQIISILKWEYRLYFYSICFFSPTHNKTEIHENLKFMQILKVYFVFVIYKLIITDMVELVRDFSENSL